MGHLPGNLLPPIEIILAIGQPKELLRSRENEENGTKQQTQKPANVKEKTALNKCARAIQKMC